MNTPEVDIRVTSNILSPSRGTLNSVTIIIDTKSDEIHENPTTGHRTLTGRSTPVYPPVLINVNLRSSSHGYIQQLLRDKLGSHHDWLCAELASDISGTAKELGFGRNGFVMDVFVKITYQNVVVLSDPSPPSNDEALSLKAVILRLVLLGRIRGEELKSLEMETESSCSICLDNLSGSSKHGVATRMNCSHVFHGQCLLEWLHRKNTCPLCRTVLYDR